MMFFYYLCNKCFFCLDLVPFDEKARKAGLGGRGRPKRTRLSPSSVADTAGQMVSESGFHGLLSWVVFVWIGFG
jgi:hypothetical protein